MQAPDPIQQAPKAFSAIVSAVNGLIRCARPWTNVQGKNGITVTASDTNVIIDAGGLEDRLGEVEEAVDFGTPFFLYDAGGGLNLGVRVGMVNNAIPTIDDGGATHLDAVPPPVLTVTGTSGQVYIKITHDAAGEITDAEIESASSVPADTSTEKHKLLGTWTASGGAFTAVTPILRANQTFYLCGGTGIFET